MGQREEYYKPGQPVRVVDTREIQEEKSKIIAWMKKEAHKELKETDWMLIRKMERQKEVPEEISKWRLSVIKKIEEIELDLEKINTLEEFDKYSKVGEFNKLVKGD